MSLLDCVDAVLVKYLNVDLLTTSPGSGEVGEGGRRGESQQFYVMLGLPTLYWASLAKR